MSRMTLPGGLDPDCLRQGHLWEPSPEGTPRVRCQRCPSVKTADGRILSLADRRAFSPSWAYFGPDGVPDPIFTARDPRGLTTLRTRADRQPVRRLFDSRGESLPACGRQPALTLADCVVREVPRAP